jgi:RNA polymerase sigma factor (sigma-70 family)
MSPFDRVSETPDPENVPTRTRLDERFLASLVGDTPMDRVEGQELRQIFMAALEQLTADELRVIELRFQRKKSPGQVASQLRIPKEEVAAREQRAIEKLRGPISAYLEL